MKAMRVSAYDDDAVFEVAEIEKLELKTGHVLVKIATSSATPSTR